LALFFADAFFDTGRAQSGTNANSALNHQHQYAAMHIKKAPRTPS
jgi:hypothetical protein